MPPVYYCLGRLPTNPISLIWVGFAWRHKQCSSSMVSIRKWQTCKWTFFLRTVSYVWNFQANFYCCAIQRSMILLCVRSVMIVLDFCYEFIVNFKWKIVFQFISPIKCNSIWEIFFTNALMKLCESIILYIYFSVSIQLLYNINRTEWINPTQLNTKPRVHIKLSIWISFKYDSQ